MQRGTFHFLASLTPKPYFGHGQIAMEIPLHLDALGPPPQKKLTADGRHCAGTVNGQWRRRPPADTHIFMFVRSVQQGILGNGSIKWETTPIIAELFDDFLFFVLFFLKMATDAARSDGVRDVSSTGGDRVFAGTLLRKIVSSYNQAQDDVHRGYLRSKRGTTSEIVRVKILWLQI